ncbi:YmaF family protein [Paenibacillus sp. BC26]|uniref:YmaF family protein n=1 Tax=Paenibacillus sp. BC26 TaxID=1881032 RepID=UPI0008E658C6|nr:YmaF family protein [Paenibacillus sp. BC26]SFS67471.1 YmaF family protein [Paenibacillus sp. BC26]
MDIPITGFIVHNGYSDEDHTHILYLTSWDGKPMHVHDFSGVTSVEIGHHHQYAGTTEPAPSGVQHCHYYCTVTSVNSGHKHTIKGTTGPALPLSGGGHYHYFEGCTTVDGLTPHAHFYCGHTGNAIADNRC